VIYHQSLTTMKSEAKRASLRRGSKDQSMAGEKATCLEFGVLTLEGDGA
jgi:syntaxin-binding protein 5